MEKIENSEVALAQKRHKEGKKAGIVGIIANIILFAIKVSVGIICGSVSVVADAINNLSDAGSSVFVFVGYHMAGKPADKEHPYGHERIEYLCGLFISVIITVLGIELMRDSVGQLISGEGSAKFTVAAIIVMGVTMLGKGAMSLYYSIVAKKIGSQSLKASAIDSLGDIFATGAVMVGMIISRYTGPRTDGVLGCIIALYIIIMGLKLTKESSDTLIGTAPDADFVAKIAQAIRSYKGVVGIHDLVVHSYGASRTFVSCHVEVDAAVDVLESHDMIDNIEEDFRKERNIDLVIHLDPIQCSDPKVIVIRDKVSHILSQISSEYQCPVSMHDFRVVFGVTHSNLIFDVAITNEFPIDDKKLCETIAAEVKNIDASYNTVITVDRDYSTHRFGEKIN